MDITEIKERLEAIGKRLVEITQEQSQSGLDLARAQGAQSREACADPVRVCLPLARLT